MHPRDFLSRCARTWPEGTAFISGKEDRTWEELDRRAEKLASVLRSFGVEKGDAVASLGHEHIEKPEIIFACLKLGAIRVGINWRYSADQMLHILRDSDTKVAFIQANCLDPLHDHLEDLENEGRKLVGFRGDHPLPYDYDSLLREADGDPGPPSLEDDDLAMYIYTSGTTGRPKGAKVTQGNLRESLIQGALSTGFNHEDVWLNVTPHAGVTCAYSLVGLMTGMTTVLPAGDFDPRQFLKLCEKHEVTASVLVVTALRRIIEEQRKDNYDLSSFRLMAYGSETATPTVLRNAKEALDCELVQYYGMTEVAAPWVSILWDEDHERGLEGEEKLLSSCGKPNLFSELAILDDDGNELARNDRGEICIAGDVVMEGYLNLPEVTEKSFEGRWYRTGDVGYRDEDGYFYLVDRMDFLIMSGAMKIYPSAVESVLDQHEDLANLAVVGAPHPDWGEAVVAVVQPVADREIDLDELVELCREHLADYEVPKYFHVVEEIPRGVTGKIDRVGLEDTFEENPDLLPWEVPEE